ncbi:hypothetical protein CC79DRAFT_1337123 [Sarocladium strictum]
MHKTLVCTTVYLLLSLRQVVAQGTTTPIVPFSTCDITTFLCDSGDGCCPINGCCGGGCCQLGYACINEGTSDATCCPSFDLTKCGTVESPSDDSDTESDSDSSSHVCTGVRNCNNAAGNNQGWTCFMGETCGWAYGVCNPCPYLGGGGGGSSDDSNSPPTITTAPSPDSTSDSSDESTSNSGEFPSSDNGSSSDATATGDDSDPTSTSGASPAYLSKEDSPILHWLVRVVLGGIVAIGL